MTDSWPAIDVSLVLPVYNEGECVEPVIREAHGVLRGLGRSFEIVAVDDGSTDRTPVILQGLRGGMDGLRVIRLMPNSGQSAAMGIGFRHARGRVVVVMDADGQNDPADIPRMLEELGSCDVCCGYRARRQDTWSKRWGSRLANRVRNWFLKDAIRDTGCSLKAFKADWVRDLPMHLKGMHRFLPALTLMRGACIRQIAVNHRPRQGGCTKYTNVGRLKETVWDLWAMRWMQRRYRRFEAREL
jgi:glycosyltransferase involved in cell wall biosynthesis